MKFEVPIKVDIDDVTKLIHDLQCLQTYKLGVNDTMLLVSLDDVADVFADHIRAKRLDKDIDVPSKEIIHCHECKHNPLKEWFGCPMAHLSNEQRPEDAWCWKGEKEDGNVKS